MQKPEPNSHNYTMMKRILLLFLLAGFIVTSCDDDNDTPSSMFTVTVENVIPASSIFASGAVDAIPPGGTLEFSFNAGIGHYLSYSTMLVQSNDLFYAPAQNGLALYNGRTAVTGDVTAQFDLWDAGTEVNQEPGVGADQAPRQSGPDTGADENGTVGLVNDSFTYPADEDIIRVTLAHDGGTRFTVTVENLSDNATLTTPLAPGVWAIHGSTVNPFFTDGEAASQGLEESAEDGNTTNFIAALQAETGYSSPFAPGVFAVFESGDDNPIFVSGTATTNGLEGLAEDGDPSTLATSVAAAESTEAYGVFNTPVGASGPGPILTGGSYSFQFEAEEGDVLTFATMLVQTNDLFIAPPQTGIALFENGQPLSGDITNTLMLWDAGTEVNEFPGAGNYQPTRQPGGNMGTDENGLVRIVNDGYTYPTISNQVRVTISAPAN